MADESTFGTGEFERALVYAAGAHAGHLRKGTRIPYISHLLAVAALVMEADGDEDEAIAALLHDVVEDRGGAPRLAEVRELFGDRVAEIVRGCSDTDEEPKPPWRACKEQYIAHLETADPSVIRVSLADKVHNARAIVFDYWSEGEQLWRRFNEDSDQLWYSRALANAFGAKTDSGLVGELDRTVTTLENLALAGALKTLKVYRDADDSIVRSVVITADGSRNDSIRFAVDKEGLFCEVIRNTELSTPDAFTREDVAKLLAIGFEEPDSDDQNFHRVFEPRTDDCYADAVSVVRTILIEVFGLPSTQPLNVVRPRWPEPSVSRLGKRLLALVNPRTPEGEMKDSMQVWKELQAQMDANRGDRNSDDEE